MGVRIKGKDGPDGLIEWAESLKEDDPDLLEIVYSWITLQSDSYGSPPPPSRFEVLGHLKRRLSTSETTWLSSRLGQWTLDADELRAAFARLASVSWLHGQIALEPEVEAAETHASKVHRRGLSQHFEKWSDVGVAPPHEWHRYYECTVHFRVPREELAEAGTVQGVPIELRESLERFRRDHPDPARVALIIMRFGESKAHASIAEGLRYALNVHGIAAVRADEKQYHDDLFSNVATYMHGCAFAIAVYERIEEDTFNPNISLEVGYMMALRKPVCILKDRTLKTLHSDIMGRLYREFDPQDPAGTIPGELASWMRDKGFIA